MRNTDHLTNDELRELLSRPLSKEAADQLREVRKKDSWLLAQNLRDAECETKVKDETKATTRCIPLEQEPGQGVCIVCGGHATEKVIFGRAY